MENDKKIVSALEVALKLGQSEVLYRIIEILQARARFEIEMLRLKELLNLV